MDTERLAYSPGELARLLGCSRQNIYNLISRGELPSVKLGGKRLIPRQVVESLLAAPGTDLVDQADVLRRDLDARRDR